MKKWSFLFVVSSLSLFAEVIQTHQISDVFPYIDEDTWVLVDIDNTVYESKHAYGHTDWFTEHAVQRIAKGDTWDDVINSFYPLWIESQRACEVQIIEPEFIPFLFNIQNQGIITMGLTHRQPCLIDSTLKQLASVSVDFNRHPPIQGALEITKNNHSVYAHGILFTGEYNKKGETFLRFLAKTNQKPKKVILIDDREKHVREVESALSGTDIEYLGVHYTAYEHVEKVYSQEIAEYQRRHFNKVLSNEAARILLQHGIE